MPGMMDTVLNIGLNEATLAGLVAATGNERFAWDCYRRFVQMFGDVVLDMKPQTKTDVDPFEHILEELKHEKHKKEDTDLDVAELKELVKRFKKAVKERTGKDFPDDPMEQVRQAMMAVFNSWNNDRAIVYRRQYGYPHDWGTAVNIQSMVFGNMGDDSRHRRGLHPRPGHRRERVLRRVPHQRPRRGRGGRHPHAEEDRRHGQGLARQLQAVARSPADAREPLQERPGHRVHGPEGQALDAPDRATASGPGSRPSSSRWTSTTRARSARTRPSRSSGCRRTT